MHPSGGKRVSDASAQKKRGNKEEARGNLYRRQERLRRVSLRWRPFGRQLAVAALAKEVSMPADPL